MRNKSQRVTKEQNKSSHKTKPVTNKRLVGQKQNAEVYKVTMGVTAMQRNNESPRYYHKINF